MRGPTHILIGLAAGEALAYGLHLAPLPAVVLAGAGALGALLPDIDSAQSLASQRAGLVSWLLRLFVRHRGMTHGLLLPLAIVLPLIAVAHPLQREILAAGLLGYLSHLAADAVTLSGVPLLWPWAHHFHLLPPGVRLRTGGPVESVVLLVMLQACVLLALAILGWLVPLVDLVFNTIHPA